MAINFGKLVEPKGTGRACTFADHKWELELDAGGAYLRCVDPCGDGAVEKMDADSDPACRSDLCEYGVSGTLVVRVKVHSTPPSDGPDGHDPGEAWLEIDHTPPEEKGAGQ